MSWRVLRTMESASHHIPELLTLCANSWFDAANLPRHHTFCNGITILIILLKTKWSQRKTKENTHFSKTFKFSHHMWKLLINRANFSRRVRQTTHVHGSLRAGRGLSILRSENNKCMTSNAEFLFSGVRTCKSPPPHSKNHFMVDSKPAVCNR